MMYRQGFAAISSVLIVSSFVLVVTLGVALRSISSLQVGISEERATRALVLAESCVEVALLELQRTFGYAGGESILIGSDYCSVETLSGTGNKDRTIIATSTIASYARAVEVNISEVSPQTVISSWSLIGTP